jgi:Rieske Fe-S protein
MQGLEFEQFGMSAKVKAMVKSKCKHGACLVPGCASQAAKGKRGLCDSHYSQFNYAKRKRKSAAARAAFDADKVRRGLIKAPRRGRRSVNAFEV